MPSLWMTGGKQMRLTLKSQRLYELVLCEGSQTVVARLPITPDEIDGMVGGRPWERGGLTILDGAVVRFLIDGQEWGHVPQIEWDRLVDAVMSEDDALAG
jgi:hypothetical protein